MEFMAGELLTAHAKLDSIGVPRRSFDGAPLSIAQRVDEAVTMYRSLLAANTAIARARSA